MQQFFLHFGMRSLKVYVRKTSLAIGTAEAVLDKNEKKKKLFVFCFNSFKVVLFCLYTTCSDIYCPVLAFSLP